MNEDIKDAIALAEDTLDDAIFNAKDNRNRVAMNRCYYAYFYIIRSLLLEKNIRSKTHSGLLSEFGRTFIKTGIIPKEFSHNLAFLFDQRQTADYEPEEEIGKEEIDEALRMVEEFINFVKEKYQ
jgi:uncharacterized protein (UPF0332 family)